MSITIKNIVMLGSGNLATHLSHALIDKGFKIIQVYSRTPDNAERLAKELKCGYTSEIANISSECDLYFFALSDTAIPKLLEHEIFKDKILVHGAGSVHLNIFENQTSRYGVIYPLMGFTIGRPVDFNFIPLFIESSTNEVNTSLTSIAERLSNEVHYANSEERLMLHLAAVFASNFSNHMLSVAEKLLASTNIPFETLKPLMLETAQKAFAVGPLKAQTGPAVRNNKDVMDKHISMLAKNPDWQKIYTFVSENIRKMKNEW